MSIGYLFHLYIFQEAKPDPKSYFEPGDVISTEADGNRIKVLDEEGENLRLELTFEPGAEGPPLHIQTGWDEKYKVISGELTLFLDGEVKKLGTGEKNYNSKRRYTQTI